MSLSLFILIQLRQNGYFWVKLFISNWRNNRFYLSMTQKCKFSINVIHTKLTKQLYTIYIRHKQIFPRHISLWFKEKFVFSFLTNTWKIEFKSTGLFIIIAQNVPLITFCVKTNFREFLFWRYFSIFKN